MVIPQFIPTVFSPVVTAMSTELGHAVNYRWGHKRFVSGILDAKDQAKTKTPNLPLLWLVMDFKESKGENVQVYSKLTGISFVFCAKTSPNATSAQTEANFKNVLLPMYASFVNAISQSSVFRRPTATLLKHDFILRPYWGQGAVNLFNDYTDCIEINNLNLDVAALLCVPGSQSFKL